MKHLRYRYAFSREKIAPPALIISWEFTVRTLAFANVPHISQDEPVALLDKKKYGTVIWLPPVISDILIAILFDTKLSGYKELYVGTEW